MTAAASPARARAAYNWRDGDGRLWHAVPTVTQGEKVDLTSRRKPRMVDGEPYVYTSYDDTLVTHYRVDEPAQLTLLET